MYEDETLDHVPAFRSHLHDAFLRNAHLIYIGWHIHVPMIDYYCSSFRSIAIIELWPGNARLARETHPHAEVVETDLRDYTPQSLEGGATLLWQQGPEHLTAADAEVAVRRWKEHVRTIILEAPNGSRHQGGAGSNPFEAHLSVWSRGDFSRLGFCNALFMDPDRCGAIIGYWEQTRDVNRRPAYA